MGLPIIPCRSHVTAAGLGNEPALLKMKTFEKLVKVLGKEPALRLPSFSRVSPKIVLAA